MRRTYFLHEQRAERLAFVDQIRDETRLQMRLKPERVRIVVLCEGEPQQQMSVYLIEAVAVISIIPAVLTY